MRIVYCQCSVYNPGGMERVLLNKVEWLARHGHEVTVVTTDQAGRAPFYAFPPEVRMVDLGINYSADNILPLHRKIGGYLRKRRLHRRKLAELLAEVRPDVTVSLFPSESSFIPKLTDGSRKVLELHFNKNFRVQYGRKGLLGWIDRMRQKQDELLVKRFEDFVVLTREDAEQWGNLPNMSVIPNAALPLGVEAEAESHRVIAVGRLDYQKGFDRLIDAWKLAMEKGGEAVADWRLDIFGQGEWRQMLEGKIAEYGLKNAAVNAPTKEIAREYAESSIIAMTSNYEGFPMVLIEGMECGLAPVTFDFKCGPREIIEDGVNGILVKNGDVEAFADALLRLMTNLELRRKIAKNAKASMARFSEERIMELWMKIFGK